MSGSSVDSGYPVFCTPKQGTHVVSGGPSRFYADNRFRDGITYSGAKGRRGILVTVAMAGSLTPYQHHCHKQGVLGKATSAEFPPGAMGIDDTGDTRLFKGF